VGLSKAGVIETAGTSRMLGGCSATGISERPEQQQVEP